MCLGRLRAVVVFSSDHTHKVMAKFLQMNGSALPLALFHCALQRLGEERDCSWSCIWETHPKSSRVGIHWEVNSPVMNVLMIVSEM